MIDKIRERLQKQSEEYKELAESQDSAEYQRMYEVGMQATEEALDIINQVEAEYNNGWIYCSSGQIPKDDDYILYCGNHLANMEVDCCIGEWFLNHLEYMLAWQPLPQPPKGECWKNEEDIS